MELPEGARWIISTRTGPPEAVVLIPAYFGTLLGLLFFLWYSYARHCG